MAGRLSAHVEASAFLISRGPKHNKIGRACLGNPILCIHGGGGRNLQIGPQVWQSCGQGLAHDQTECLTLYVEVVFSTNFRGQDEVKPSLGLLLVGHGGSAHLEAALCRLELLGDGFFLSLGDA